MGWGTLLPIGVIISRYFRKFPLKSDEWLPLHVLCQTSGYIVGTIGWGIGLWLGNSSKHYNTPKTHRILGILVFTFATVQMLTTTILLQARREDEWRRCWEIYHHVLGYAVIGLSAAEIFQGIMHQSHAGKWRLAYVGILAVLVFVAFALEIVRWIIKSRIQQHLPFDNNLYNHT
ncbi:cytochrome b561 and DOMON domain-containing protein At3g25290-like [Mangifera indica]|uniref:cytochrome b561 and DOMON domain-containing protein At3g25290-like n=1 Tax=Mangifera indica TaxID=29780 RepID=UPI001CF954D2|nr:cytochrome b561 and DOMON domain-containing protein At3g25290-like [Mangifera indica]